MILYKEAPAGFICQFFEDDGLHYPHTKYLDICGKWCPTLEEAVESVKKERPKKIKKLQKEIEKLQQKIKESQELIDLIESTSENVKEK